MPWQNNGGDRPNPWGGGGGGPRGGGSGGGGGGNQPPDIDAFLKKMQDNLRQAMPGGKGGFSILLLVAVVIWLFSGFYRVDTNEQGVVLRFGEWVDSTGPGLHWHLPYPVETVETPKVTSENRVDVGGQSGGKEISMGSLNESLMLTGDENIVQIKFTVVWKIADAGRYLFNLNEPGSAVRMVAQSSMREVVGQNKIEPILTTARDRIQQEVHQQLQDVLNEYEAGIEVLRVQITDADPPETVIDAFQEVQRAEQDRRRVMNEAQAYANKIIPEAEGHAIKAVEAAKAYQAEVTNRAQGQADRFDDILTEYSKARNVTRERLYLETMESVLGGTEKVILDGKAGGAVPYLPLPEIQRKTGGSAGKQGDRQ
ncbi:FtsH protease activity modulator HflK [Yunchengibacter salinarum]|uniref:FtsH protease activity modulator HflK n=1 Tax=Yunchengibacter salinarum TaxID=3133399 RepID=UPI0035B5CE65